MFNQITDFSKQKKLLDVDASDDDKFVKNTYNGRPLYERIPGYEVTPAEMDKELKYCLASFNEIYNYDSDFKKEDFEALNPIKLEKNVDRWIPFYNYGGDIKPYIISLNLEGFSCCCSQKCQSLFLIRNKKTDVYFGVGSVCITKFIDGNFANQIQYLKNIAVKKKCDICNVPIYTKTTKNQKSNWTIKNKILDNIICNKCINKIFVILDIKYSEKDELKNKYPIRWSVSGRTWYLQGRVPPELQNRIKCIHS